MIIYFVITVVSIAIESLSLDTSKARTICFFLFHGAVVRHAISIAIKATIATKIMLAKINILRLRFIFIAVVSRQKSGVSHTKKLAPDLSGGPVLATHS